MSPPRVGIKLTSLLRFHLLESPSATTLLRIMSLISSVNVGASFVPRSVGAPIRQIDSRGEGGGEGEVSHQIPGASEEVSAALD